MAADVLASELQLDRVLADLAAELPAHMRAFARAHLEGRQPPPAPPRASDPRTLDLARAAITEPETRARGWLLWRLAAPLAIEADMRVATARGGQRSWDGLAELAAARDEAAMRWLGERAIAALHRAHGVAGEAASVAQAIPDRSDGWATRDSDVDIEVAWGAIAARLGVSGVVEVVRGEPPRTFVVEAKARVICVVPAVLDTPAARFAALHELGHAACAFALPAGTPRVVDEAAAASVARWVEPGSWLPAPWVNERAVAARARRLAIARVLDATERALPALPSELPADRPPRALWLDPGAQAAYVAAEALADELPLAAGGFAQALAAARARIDVLADIPR